jgi:hypothetical protein
MDLGDLKKKIVPCVGTALMLLNIDLVRVH